MRRAVIICLKIVFMTLGYFLENLNKKLFLWGFFSSICLFFVLYPAQDSEGQVFKHTGFR